MRTAHKIHKLGDICGGVLTNGCFDLLHSAHIRYLEEIRQFGYVTVAVNSDSSVRKLKGDGRPINSEMDRALVIAALEAVTFVVIFDGDLPAVMRAIRPALWCKGSDYTMETLNPVEVATARELNIGIRLIPMTVGYSTSNIINRVVNQNA